MVEFTAAVRVKDLKPLMSVPSPTDTARPVTGLRPLGSKPETELVDDQIDAIHADRCKGAFLFPIRFPMLMEGDHE